MKSDRTKLLFRFSAILFFIFTAFAAFTAFARVGGAGGHGGHSGGGGSSGGGGFFIWYLLSAHPILTLIIVIIFIIYSVYGKKGNPGGNPAAAPLPASTSFPAGLFEEKIRGSFLAIQDAWQRKDLKNVRKWLSDGMYQRLTCQFKMMNALSQVNALSNIRISRIAATNVYSDGNYDIADIAISFTMDDRFTSSKYPQFNESYEGDTDTEYWTFIKRRDSAKEKNLYDNQNCPNCGAPFEVKMGEISRCNYCKTLTNSAAYDWVLSEITQEADYTIGGGINNDPDLKEVARKDPFFAAQRLEDVASNIFMQVMEVLTVDDKKRLKRFADQNTTDLIVRLKESRRHFVFDRLYLNYVTLSDYSIADGLIRLQFDLKATYRRVSIDGKLQMLDSDFVESPAKMELSRNVDVPVKAGTGETVYSYECSNCGAPYTDTTDDKCTYCGALVVDEKLNWVLTGFEWG